MNDNTSYREKGRAVFLAAIVTLSMVAMAATFAAPAAAEHEPAGEEVSVTDLDGGAGSNFWQGQEITITGFGNNNDVQFEQPDGDGFRTRTANADGNVTIDTTNWATGDWEVVDENDNNGSFSINAQDLEEFSFEDENTQSTTTLTVDSQRNEYNISVSSESLDSDELYEVFNHSDNDGIVYSVPHEDDSVVVLEVNDATEDFTADFSEVDAGNYTIEGEVVDTGVTASASITTEEAPDEGVTFTDSYDENAGDVADVELDVSNAGDDAYVVFSSSTVEGELVAHLDLSDYDEDTTTLGVNTYELSQGTPADVFTFDDGVTEGGNSQYNVSGDADTPHMGDLGEDRWPGGYAFTLQSYTQNPVDSDARADDRSRLSLSDRSTGDVTVGVAPGSVDIGDDTEISDLSGDVTQRDTVAEGDYVVAEVEASGIYGYVESAEDFNANGVNFYLYQETEGTFGGTNEETLNVSDGDLGSTVLMDSDNDTFVVAFQPGEVGDISTGDSWDAVFEVDDENPYYGEEDPETSSASFSFEERDLALAGEMDDEDRLQVDAQSDSQIVAETNAAPGTEGDMYVVLQDATESQDLTVDENGQLVGSFDFSDRSSGEQIETIEATLFGTNNADDITETTSGVFGDGSSASFTASGDAPSEVNVGDDAQLEATVTNDGGAAGEASISVTVDGEEVASENVEIEAGGEWSETFDINTDEEAEVDWEVDAGDSTESGTVSVVEESDDSGEDGAEPEDDSQPEDDSEDDSEDDGDSDDEGQPGFGVVVAMFALIGAALLALRRQN